MPEVTVQSDVQRSEIKHVLAKYRQVGILEHFREVDLQFRDVTEFTDFADVMRQSAAARQVFMKLPPEVRRVFNNDVAEWLDTAHDADKLEKLRPKLTELGVFAPEPVTPAAPVSSPAAVSPGNTPA